MRARICAALAAASLLTLSVPTFAQGEHEGSAKATEAKGAEHEHAEAEEHEGPAPINWADFSNKKQPPYLATLINFAILIGIYYAFGKKPIAEGLKLRRANVAKQIEEAQRMKEEAEARAQVYQAKLAHLEEELASTKATLLEAGKSEKERIVKEAHEKAERLEKDAAFMIEQEVKQMRQDLVRETVETAILAAEDLLKKRITAADQERLADEYLTELARKASPRPSTLPKPASILPSGGAS